MIALHKKIEPALFFCFKSIPFFAHYIPTDLPVPPTDDDPPELWIDKPNIWIAAILIAIAIYCYKNRSKNHNIS